MFSCKLLNVCLVLGCLLVLASAQLHIEPRDCPANEVFLKCGPSCQTECATLGQPCLIAHFRCPDGCYCKKGFARNSASTCIPLDKC